MSKHDNKGGLWRNKYKTKDFQPDYVGEVTIDGVTHKLAAWDDKTGNSKRPIVHLVVSDGRLDPKPDKDLPF